ncbi:hypothetical protein CKY14_15065 [Photorhabdus sp. S14-60]|nr:hypothetical protein CKY14_15065 [Photorhabdus sp. S14-60]RAW82732.1 hypothetical protein CKY09_16155 [Photorhabdus sp. S5P8-50]
MKNKSDNNVSNSFSIYQIIQLINYLTEYIYSYKKVKDKAFETNGNFIHLNYVGVLSLSDLCNKIFIIAIDRFTKCNFTRVLAFTSIWDY